MAVTGDEIYAGGYPNQSTSFEAVTFQGVHDDIDGFVIEIGDGGTPTLVWGQWLGGTGYDFVVALAVTGDEIYAGGYSENTNSYESVTFQRTATGQEGFIVEINDAGTPSLSWGMWLGSDWEDSVEDLAVTGDEIYAAGQAADDVGGLSFFSGTNNFTTDGFVVEIADGGTPTIIWGQWLGGNAADDNITAIAVVGDEIYAGGHAADSSLFEAVALSGSHDSVEGLLIEIADDGAGGGGGTQDTMFFGPMF